MAVAILSTTGLVLAGLNATTASAAEPTVGLGTAANYAVLAGSTVTNTGTSSIVGFDVGVSPGSAITGFPPGLISAPGTQHAADAAAAQAQNDATTAFNDAAGRSNPTTTGLTDLSGPTLQPGVYKGGALSLSGTLTLDNNDDPDAVFIFQASSTLITSSNSVVTFTNADHPSCNVFWQIGSSATLGTGTSFVGTVLAQQDITADTGATVQGRLLASVGAVTLDDNTITRLKCADTSGGTTTSTPTSATSTSATSTSATSTSATSTSRTPASSTPKPVTPTSPPRDITSGRSVSIIVPVTTPTLKTATKTKTTALTTRRSTATQTFTQTSTWTRSTTTSDTGMLVYGSGGSGSKTTDLAATGPAPVAGMTFAGGLAVALGATVLLLAGRRRSRGGLHRAAH